MTTIPHFHDDPQYLDALVRDYLELMGEAPEPSTLTPSNNLLMEYDTPHGVRDQSTEDIAGTD